MSDNLEIRIDGWLPDGVGPDPVARTHAEIFIAAGDFCATEVHDRLANTVRRTIRASAYLIAAWLASNWWRLTREPHREYFSDPATQLDWKMTHQMGAIGGGYLWPPLTLSSDGHHVLVQSDVSTSYMRTDLSPIRYISSFSSMVSIEGLEVAIERFVESVLSRLDALRLRDTPLHQLWKEISSERKEKRLREIRHIEALLGLDPDMQSERVKAILRWKSKAGLEAVNEIAAAMTTDHCERVFEQTHTAIRSIRTFARVEEFGKVESGIVDFGSLRSSIPWELGKGIAERVRAIWSLGVDPVPNRKLAELLNVQQGILDTSAADAPVTVGTKGNAEDQLKLVLRQNQNPSSRRFEIARLLGDFLLCKSNNGWLPVTLAQTARQKFQRAFAAEFLCPSDALKVRFEHDVHDNDEREWFVEVQAQEYEVSSMVIEHHLSNRSASLVY